MISICLRTICALGLLTGTCSATAAAVTIEYIAHASFRLVAADGSSLIIDPYADRVWLSYDYPRGLQGDAWLVSHPHYDHDGGDYRGMDPPWPEDARVIRFPGRFEVGSFEVTGIKGHHAEPYGEEFGRFNTVWRLEVDGMTLAHWGDNEPLTAAMAAALEGVDVLMLPVDGEEHLISFAATEEIIRRLEPKVLIPMHYRLADLEPSPDTPKNLGGIDSWLADQESVVRVDGHRLQLTTDALPSQGTVIYAFKHSPVVRKPTN